jgi:hypothetical protein
LEPHVAKQQVFLEMMSEANVTLLPFGQVETVTKNELGFITSITIDMTTTATTEATITETQ